jgi:hypothetical protein
MEALFFFSGPDDVKKKSMGGRYARRPRAAFGAMCPGECTQGKTYSNREDETGSTCRVCGGAGWVPDDELAAWKEDPAYARNPSDSYTGFYEQEFVKYVQGEVWRGALPLITLKEFVAQRRAEQNVPPIDANLIREDIRAGDVQLRCPAGCSSGLHTLHYDQDTHFPCTVCAVYKGTGTILASTLARWMSDPQYRDYYQRLGYEKSKMAPYDAWKHERERGSAPKPMPSPSIPVPVPIPETMTPLAPLAPSVPMAPMAQSLPRPPKPPTTMSKLVNWVSGARGHHQRKKTKASDPSLKDLCVMCLDLEKNTAFDQCGHFGFCSKCTEGLQMCPECEKPGKPIRIYNVTRLRAPMER